MLYLLLALLAWRPEGFDNLPPNYTAWDADSTFYHPPLEGLPCEVWEGHFPPFNYPADSGFTSMYTLKVPIISDLTDLPFTATLGELESWQACGDRLYGMVQFAADTNPDWSVSGQWITVYWAPHEEGVSENRDIANRLYPRDDVFDYRYQCHLAVQKSFEKINVGDIPACRHKGRWWFQGGCACGAYDFGGSFSTYIVPTPGLDFHITCATVTFEWDTNPWVGYEEDEIDTLPKEIRNSWPDDIRQLERAVEQTFRPK